MGENNHATSADLKALEERLKTYIDEREGQLEGRLKSYLGEQLERLETKLLTAFHGWARSIEIRVRTDEAAAHGVDERVALLEERVSRLERGTQ